jgi:glycolate oxidase
VALHTETRSPASGPPPEQSPNNRGALIDTSDRRNAPVDTNRLAALLAEIVGERGVLARPSELATYSSDGLPGYRLRPRLAVFPTTKQQLTSVVRLLAREHTPFVARGAGTGLSAGALASGDAVVVGLSRLNKILSIDPVNRLAVVEPGAVNVTLTRAAGAHGLHYAPDPSSQTACTIGGNVAENSGGPHCLKYGVTLNHVVALEVILASGEIVQLGNANGEVDGYDLLGAHSRSQSSSRPIRRACARCSPTSCPSTQARARPRRSSRREFSPRRWR